jgi:hypothetical protein
VQCRRGLLIDPNNAAFPKTAQLRSRCNYEIG